MDEDDGSFLINLSKKQETKLLPALLSDKEMKMQDTVILKCQNNLELNKQKNLGSQSPIGTQSENFKTS